MSKYASFWAVIFTIFLIVGLSFVNLQIGGIPSSDPIYVDLQEFPAYVKTGFKLSDADVSEYAPEDWDLALPPHSGAVIISDLPLPVPESVAVKQRGRYSAANRPIEEFTVYIPFELDERQYDSLYSRGFIQPGLYFVGIGENWEIFVNGNVICEQIFLNENNEITEFRSQRGVTVPFDRQYLKQGVNNLVIRIVGARSAYWTGLAYDTPYYLGDYANMKNDASVLSSEILSAICIISGFYHILLFFLRKTDKHNITFSIFSVLLGLYLFARSPAVYSLLPDTKYAQRLEYFSMFMLACTLAIFIETLNQRKISLPTKIYTAFCSVLTVLQFLFPIWFSYGLVQIWSLTSPVFFVYVLYFDLVRPMVKSVSKRREAERADGGKRGFWRLFFISMVDREFGSIFLLIVMVALMAIFDLIDTALFYSGIFLSRYAFLGFLLCMAYVLARKYANQYEITEQMNEKLDRIVKMRTQELEEQKLIAENANRSKSDFLAKMSHEIRTPMNAITGMAEFALREDLPNAAREYTLTIKQAGANLLSIINEILDFSKIESGKLEITEGDYLLSSLLNDVVSIIRMKTLDTPIRFVVNIDSGIPNALYGDEIRIRQILLNILSNAVKYTEEGYVSFTVTGKTDNDTVNLAAEVADSGKGIKPEDIEKLFGDFVQVDLFSNRGIEGTGLGLAITHSLVKAMNGNITVSSDYGKGSTFTVTLPQKIREYKKIASVETPEEKRVLVYELRDTYADSIVRAINNLSVRCTLVSNHSEFRAEISGGKYDFMFVASALYADETVRKICREVPPDAKIVILAGFGETVAQRDLRVLSMPVHSISVANILNGADDGFSYNESGVTAAMFTAEEASVLVVDDIDTNLSVAYGLLLPYKMRVDLCSGGMEAIEAVTAGRFDLILMDHMMPEMDGIETTARIRALAANDLYYETLPIIALTANAVTGAKEMFLKHGFNDFLSKPIDTFKLNTVLEKWLPKEKQKKSKTEIDAYQAATGKNPKLLKVFRNDAEKAIVTLRETAESGNIKLFTTAAHAMKSALANIGENEVSELAFALEKAGLDSDTGFISANVDGLISALETLIVDISSKAVKTSKETDAEEDKAFLAEQLSIVKTACENYDDTAAYAALDRLDEKPRKPETAAVLEQIRGSLFLHSDFEKAANFAKELLSEEKQKKN